MFLSPDNVSNNKLWEEAAQHLEVPLLSQHREKQPTQKFHYLFALCLLMEWKVFASVQVLDKYKIQHFSLPNYVRRSLCVIKKSMLWMRILTNCVKRSNKCRGSNKQWTSCVSKLTSNKGNCMILLMLSPSLKKVARWKTFVLRHKQLKMNLINSAMKLILLTKPVLRPNNV